MAMTLTLRAQSAEGVIERTFTRTPVFIGRKAGPGQFDINDGRASKLHASIDVRDGRISVRDATSTNGTFSHGKRLEANRWTDLGGADQPVEFQIGRTSFTAWASEPEPASISTTARLGGRMGGSQFGSESATARRMAQVSPRVLSKFEQNATAPGKGGAAFDGNAAKQRLTAACDDACSAAHTLERVLRLELDPAAPEARARICQDLLEAHAGLSQNRSIVALFEHYGVDTSEMKDPSDPLATTALAALQDIAVWYAGESRELKRPEDVEAFHDRLRTTLDDLLLGYAPLLSGLTRFENEMAIRSPNASPGVESAAELAASLLDWQTDNGRIRAELRASFAELMMHQVALLRGVMRGVKTLLAELSPEVIEKAVEAESTQGSIRRLFVRPDPWTTYKRRHSDLSDEENERFRILFGAEFVSEYRQFAKEAGADTAAADPARSPHT
jgi:type VI secretion system protein ImpI